jgi:hypothetical protein
MEETVTVGELTAEEFERLVERAVDRRLEVWLTQVVDTLMGLQGEEDAALRPEFAASLRRSLEQARAGEGTDLDTFRQQIGR